MTSRGSTPGSAPTRGTTSRRPRCRCAYRRTRKVRLPRASDPCSLFSGVHARCAKHVELLRLGTAVLDLTRYGMPYACVRRREQQLWVAAVRARGSVGFGHPCNMALTHRVGVGWVPRSPGRPGRALLPRGRFHGDLTARLKQHYISKHIWNCWPSCAFKNASSLVFVGTTAEQGRSDLDPLKASVHTPTCPKH